MSDEKFCKYCGESKPKVMFNVRLASPDGLTYKCKACSLAYHQERYRSDPAYRQAAIDRGTKWAKTNPEKRLQVTRSYTSRNLDKERERHRASRFVAYHRDIESSRRMMRIYAQRRRSAGELPEAVVIVLFDVARGRCVYCGRQGNPTIDHFDPISAGGTNRWDNLVAACKSCNSSKNDSYCPDWLYDKHGAEGLARAFVFLKAMRKSVRRLMPERYWAVVADEASARASC